MLRRRTDNDEQPYVYTACTRRAAQQEASGVLNAVSSPRTQRNCGADTVITLARCVCVCVCVCVFLGVYVSMIKRKPLIGMT